MLDLVADTNVEVGEQDEWHRCDEKTGDYVESTIASVAGMEGVQIQQARRQYAKKAVGRFESNDGVIGFGHRNECWKNRYGGLCELWE